MIGAITFGHNNIDKLASISTNNEVTASVEDVEAALANGTLADLRLKSALKAFIIFCLCRYYRFRYELSAVPCFR